MMSIKNLFEKPSTIQNASTSSLKVESKDFILSDVKRKQTFSPFIDFSSASNFAKFGSAYEYYTTSLARVYGEYPYDGSEKEKIEFELSSSYLDKYIFDKLYPKTTGYINFSHGGYGAASLGAQGYGQPTSPEFIYIAGGLHTASSGMQSLPLYKTFDSSTVYDTTKLRTTTFVLDTTKGWTVEFWLKKEGFEYDKSFREVLLDLWNNLPTGNSSYGRFTLSLNGNPAANGLNSFQLTFREGTRTGGKGIYEQTVCSSTFHTSSLANWGHYALSVVSESSGLITRFYHNGVLNQKTTHNVGGEMSTMSGRVNGHIGALIATTSHLSPNSAFAGKLSASLDEFRFWKTRRTSREINDNYYIPVGGGTNTDDANVELGLYFKFNEGTTGRPTTDSIVLDYSGRIANGNWTGYSAGARESESAIVLSGKAKTEKPDPIIYSFHPDVEELITELQTSGSEWDENNPSLLYNTIPEWIREEDEATNNNVKYLYQIMSSYFDTLYSQITALPKLQNNAYPSASFKALPFSKELLENRGLVTQNIFVESEIFELFGNRDKNNILYEEELNEVKNLIYTNIYNNLDYIYRSKGTEKSIRNMLRCFGIDDEIVKLNVYTDGGTQYFNDNYKQTSQTTKYIDFNSKTTLNSTVFLTSSAINGNSFITGSEAANNEQFSAFTAEADVILPYKLKMHEEGHFDSPFVSASVFGMHRPADLTSGPDYSWRTVLEDIGNFQVFVVKEDRESEKAKFVLSNRDGSIHLTSSFYKQVYNNQRWNLAVRVKPDKYPLIGNVLTSSNHTYDIEFYGVTHEYDTVKHEFSLSTSISYTSGSAYLCHPKRFYFGAHRENFTGSVLQQSDVKIGSLRFYLDHLDNSILREHNKDPANYGLRKTYQNPTLFAQNISTYVPSSDLIAFNFDLSNVTGSDSSGQFIVEDLSSGSTNTIYGWIDNVTRREHRAKGFGFPASVNSFIDNEPIFSMKKELPEIAFTSNSIFIKGKKEEVISKDDDVSDNFYALEKSMNQVVSEEMLKTFSSVKVMNNLIGKAVDRYRLDYKSLAVARRLFFEQNDGDPDFDRFTSYFKWIDLSVSQMVNQLFPISVRYADKITNMVESHILERNKYQNKFPLLERYSATETSIKSQGEIRYNWKFGHAPLPDDENKNCLWNKERKERSDITERQTINDIILNNNNAKALSASTVGGVVYEGSTYAVRRLAKPYSISTTLTNTMHPGINYAPDKDREYIHNAVSRHGKKTNIGLPVNVLLVGESAGHGIHEQQRCDDIEDPNFKEKLNVKVVAGKYAGDGIDPSPANDQEVYNYRTDVSKLPINLISQSVNTGYQFRVSSSYRSDVVITNIHTDTTDFTNHIPLQGPFTQQWVGGHQSRHIDVNKYDTSLRDDDTGGTPPNNLQNQYTRPEAWRLLLGERDPYNGNPNDGAFGFTGFDYGGPYPDPARKGATLYRGERAKRPVNISNVKTTTSSYNHGNYYENHELISTVGKQENNLYFKRNPDQANYLPSYAISSSLQTATHPLSLVAYRASTEGGNVFGTHSNNRQPDQIFQAGAKATGHFFAYGVSGSTEYKNLNHYVTDGHGVKLPPAFQDNFSDVDIELDNNDTRRSATTGLNLRILTGSNTIYWNALRDELNSDANLSATYEVINATNNYTTGIDTIASASVHSALSCSNFNGHAAGRMTFSTWLQFSTSSNGAEQYIMEVKDLASNKSSVELFLQSSGQIRFVRHSRLGSQRCSIDDFRQDNLGSWIHFVVTSGTDTDTDGNTKFYLNGELQSLTSDQEDSSGTAGSPAELTGALFLMSNAEPPTDANPQYKTLHGKMDECTFWKGTMTDAQVKALYNAGIALNFTSSEYANHSDLPQPDLLALCGWWSFDQITGSLSSGDKISDLHSTSHDLVVDDHYHDTSPSNRQKMFHPAHGIYRAKPMARFDITASVNGSSFNGLAPSGVDSVYGFASSSVEGTNGLYYYPDHSSSFSGSGIGGFTFSGGIDDVAAIRNLHQINDSLISGEKNRTIITSRFSAPGGIEIQSKGYLDAYAHEYSVHNALPFRNLTVRSSGSGESGTMRALDIHGNRSGLRTHLQRHSGKFGSDSAVGSVTSEDYVTVPSFHKIPRNVSRKPVSGGHFASPSFNLDHDNAFIQRPIPQSDFQYSWVTASIGSNFAVGSGQQRIYGYSPRDGRITGSFGDIEAIAFPTASEIFGV